MVNLPRASVAQFARARLATPRVTSSTLLSPRTARPAFPSSTTPSALRARFVSSFDGPKVKKEVTADTTRRNALIAAVLLAASGALWYYETRQMGVYPTKAKDDFTIVVGKGAGRQSVTFERKTNAEMEAMLHEHEATTVPARLGNPVARWDTNFVASNEPCEDRNAADIVPRGKEGEGAKRDLAFFSVIDGHAGSATSELLSRTLHPTLALGLAGLQAGIVPGRSWYQQLYDTLTWAKTWSPLNIAKSLESS